MNKPVDQSVHVLLAVLSLSAVLSAPTLLAAGGGPVVAKPVVNAAVTITDNGRAWTLDNGIVKATINKNNGNMPSLIYHGVETMGTGGNSGGYWEETPQAAPQLTQTVTIDPAKNGGARAEVAVKGVTGGTVMLTPGAPGGGTYCDIEVRYAWAAATAAFTPTPFSPTRPPTARWAWARAATSPSSTRPSTGFRWTLTGTCSNARRRIGARASNPRQGTADFEHRPL